MNRAILAGAGLLLALLATSAAARDSEPTAVQDLHPSHLGITVEAPGTEGWLVAEERSKKGWQLLYRHADSADESRTSGVLLKSDQFGKGKFARREGSLEQLAQKVLRETRTPDNAQYLEKWAEVKRADVHGVEAWRLRIAWEERNNPHHAGAVLLMEVSQLLMLHPLDPDRVISVVASTRRKVEQEALSADALLDSFVGAMRLL